MSEPLTELRESEHSVEAPAATPSTTGSDPAREAKLRERRWVWKWNWKLLNWTILVSLAVFLLAGASYWYHSKTAAESFLTLSELARDDGDYSRQGKWLKRYSMMRPDDQQVIVDVALAADAAADEAKVGNRRVAIDSARKQLAKSILLVDADSAEVLGDLRRRLIKRLIQLGGFWMLEAERQTISLDAPPNDPDAMRWMALAIIGQVNTDFYVPRDPIQFDRDTDFWRWLSHQEPGHVLLLGMDANQDDLELASVFLNAARNTPEIFEFETDYGVTPAWQGDVQERIDDVAASLEQRSESRAKWLLYQFLGTEGRDEEAIEIVVDRAPESFESLRKVEESEQELRSVGGEEYPKEYWDYVLLMEGARRTAESNPELARQWYDRLRAIDSKVIEIQLVETVFNQAALLEVATGNLPRAYEIWELGLDRSPNCLQLLTSMLSQRVQDGGDDKSALLAAEKLRSAIDFNKSRLARLSDNQLPQAIRKEAQRGIDAAKWQLLAMEAMLSRRNGDTRTAIDQLTAALESSVEVESSKRLFVARQLAEVYSEMAAWDQVARTLQRGLDFEPDNRALRAQVASAWQKAGNRLESIEQWRLAGSSDSVAMQFAAVEAMFNYQLRISPSQRDFSGVRSSIDRIRRRLPKRGTSENEAGNRALDTGWAMLRVLEASLPPAGVRAEAHLRSDECAQNVLEVADEFPNQAVVQVFAAERLASVGRASESQKLVSRLEKILGPDATPVVIVKARILAEQGNFLEASELCADQVKRDELRASELLRSSASFAIEAGEYGLAFERLLEIPDAEESLAIVYQLADLAPRVEADSELLNQNGSDLSPQEFAQQWAEKLREVEGEDGTYWRFITAMNLFDKLKYRNGRDMASDPTVGEFRRLSKEIIERRPSWGSAVSLEGYWLAIQATIKSDDVSSQVVQREKAVEQLRRGIASGDNQLRTRFLLISLLRSLRREAEADEELDLASYRTNIEVDEKSKLKIDLARRQGQFERAVEIAEEEVAESPEDFLSHVILCRSAIDAANNSSDGALRMEYLDKAEASLAKASTLSKTDKVEVISARLELLLARGLMDQIDDEVARIAEADVDEYDKLLLTYRAYNKAGRLEDALKALEAASEIRPRVRSYLMLAELYDRLDQFNDVEVVLRKAYELDPQNEKLRYWFAKSLVSRGQDGDGIEWDQVERLLSDSDSASLKNRYQYAALLYMRGDAEQRKEAVGILRSVVQDRNAMSEDAQRLLIAFLRDQIKKVAASDQEKVQSLDEEIRSSFLSLTQGVSPKVGDLYNYANYLMESGRSEDLPYVEQIGNRLRSTKDGGVFGLEVGVRHLQRVKNVGENLHEYVNSWASEMRRRGTMSERDIATAAGIAMVKLGFEEEGLDYFRSFYEEDSDGLSSLVVALVGADRIDEAVETCFERLRKDGDVNAATLLVESLIARGDTELSPQHAELIERAMSEFDSNVALLESVATLRLQQKQPMEAVRLYRQILKIDPLRIRTLNNLAMAYTELDGRASEGIQPIDRAIVLAGEAPELLDTKGVVLLRSGQPGAAQELFQRAFDLSQEPRFQFHLILALMAADKIQDAEKAWGQLDFERLDTSGLTSSERIQLTEMRQKFQT